MIHVVMTVKSIKIISVHSILNNTQDHHEPPNDSKYHSSTDGHNVPAFGTACSTLGTLIVSSTPGGVNLKRESQDSRNFGRELYVCIYIHYASQIIVGTY